MREFNSSILSCGGTLMAVDERMQQLRRQIEQRRQREILIGQLPSETSHWLKNRPFDYADSVHEKSGHDIFSVVQTLPLPPKIPGFSSVTLWDSSNKIALSDRLLKEARSLEGQNWLRVGDGPFYLLEAEECYRMLRTLGQFCETVEVVSADFNAGFYVANYAGLACENSVAFRGATIYELIVWTRPAKKQNI